MQLESRMAEHSVDDWSDERQKAFKEGEGEDHSCLENVQTTWGSLGVWLGFEMPANPTKSRD